MQNPSRPNAKSRIVFSEIGIRKIIETSRNKFIDSVFRGAFSCKKHSIPLILYYRRLLIWNKENGNGAAVNLLRVWWGLFLITKLNTDEVFETQRIELGPQFLNLFNDIGDNSLTVKHLLYTDDMKLYVKTCKVLQNSLRSVHQWCLRNRLCVCLIFNRTLYIQLYIQILTTHCCEI